MATENPNDEQRQDAQQRLRYLKYGAVGLTVAGLGVFAGLAAAGTSSGPDHPQGDHHDARQGSASGQDLDGDGRVGDPGDGYFDGQGYPGAVGPGGGHGDQAGGHGDQAGGYGDQAGGYGDQAGGYGDQQSQAPSGGGYGGRMPSQGSSGAS